MARASDPIAAPWHTAALIALILCVATTGTLLSRSGSLPQAANGSDRLTAVYLPMLIVNSSLALYVCRIGRPRNALRSLLGEGWSRVGRACADVALGFVGWLLILAVEAAWVRLFGPHAGAAVLGALPRSAGERIAWVVVSVSVGFCEEIVYRGYLQTQLAAFTRRPAVAIALQAALFGYAHADQGAGSAVRLALYGLALGALAWWRRSRVAGIVCHVWTNIASGLLRR